MANKVYGAIALTGGGTGALDAIDGTDLADKDMAIVVVGSAAYFYILDADSAAAEASPHIIAPDSNGGDKRWLLCGPEYAAKDNLYLRNSAGGSTELTFLGPTNADSYRLIYLHGNNACGLWDDLNTGYGQWITKAGNLFFGSNEAQSAGTNAFRILLMGNLAVTAPSAVATDHVQLWCADYASGDARLYIMGEKSTGTVIIGDGKVIAKDFVNASEYDNGNSGTEKTVDWNNGQYQKLTMTGNCTITFTAPTCGVGRYQLKLIQDGTGSRSVTWPTIKWAGAVAPVLSTAASSIDIITIYYDGTAYYGAWATGFATP